MTKFIFNGHEFYIDDKLGRVIENFVKRYNKNNDNLLIISGNTGTGKSNLATLCCAYYSFLTGIPYNVNRVFFKSPEFVKEAISTDCQIFHYDESLFSAMAQDWQMKEQKELIKMLLLCRKKRHFYVFCIPDFFKLKDTIKVEKCNGLIYTHMRKATIPGRFLYFRGRKREKLLSTYQKKKRKKYFMFKSFRGTFAKVLPKIIDEIIYDRNKDKAILSLMGPKEKNKDKLKLNQLKTKVFKLNKIFHIKQKDLAKALDLNLKTFEKWKNLNRESSDTEDSLFNTNRVMDN